MLVKCVASGVAVKDALKMLGLNKTVYRLADVMQKVDEAKWQAQRMMLTG